MSTQNDVYYIIRVCYASKNKVTSRYIKEVECVQKKKLDMMPDDEIRSNIIDVVYPNNNAPNLNQEIEHFSKDIIISEIKAKTKVFHTILFDASGTKVKYYEEALVDIYHDGKHITTEKNITLKDNLGNLPEYECKC